MITAMLASSVDLRRPVAKQCDHHCGDHQQRDPGGARVGAVEAGLLAPPGWRFHQPGDAEDDDAGEDPDREQVLDEADHCPVPDHRDCEVLVHERVSESFDDRKQQDQEAPEHQGVREPGPPAFEQLPLAEHLGEFRAQAAQRTVRASRRGCSRPDQAPQPQQPPAGQAQPGEHDGPAKHDPDGHGSSSGGR